MVISTLGTPNNVYTAVWNVTAGVATLVISGVTGFDLTAGMLNSIWDVTTSTFLNTKRVTCTYAYVAGLPVWTYTLFSVPVGTVTGDTLVITLDIPDALADYVVNQYIASKA